MSRIFRRSLSSFKRAPQLAQPFPIAEDSAQFAAHLNNVFPSLHFPPELAQRILTHGSHKAAIHGHNGRLSFIGRRVLESYYLLFLHSVARNQNHQHDYEYLSSRALNTYLLGEHVAPRWSLGRILRWTPTVSQDVLLAHKKLKSSSGKQHAEVDSDIQSMGNPGIVRSVGLYKVMGDAVQSVMGGVYHQFGGSVAHRLFHTRILPHILLPDQAEGVPVDFHRQALLLCERMGGVDGNLLVQELASNRAPSELELEVVETIQPKQVAAASS
ncbi:hypothetical protein DEU56DRAFT_968918 [Suillus clintonianus]|uniref:uncharacterized protein n=1 Tax=Suillus clintonianus TaxID=1904413 RepID=UPI001B860F61|nr:uncharacterized protein DEU56DRAFT_968918 [Suillus clintonianus]KAG2157203.1 hypothetical protein DEU56DRAFT_968918 [Suillus clintonianus]